MWCLWIWGGGGEGSFFINKGFCPRKDLMPYQDYTLFACTQRKRHLRDWIALRLYLAQPKDKFFHNQLKGTKKDTNLNLQFLNNSFKERFSTGFTSYWMKVVANACWELTNILKIQTSVKFRRKRSQIYYWRHWHTLLLVNLFFSSCTV